VRDVIRAHRWWDKGELGLRFGEDPPHALLLAIEIYAATMASVRAHDLQKEAEERERAKRNDKPPPGPGPRGRPGKR
jgi:hypothetical protein